MKDDLPGLLNCSHLCRTVRSQHVGELQDRLPSPTARLGRGLYPGGSEEILVCDRVAEAGRIRSRRGLREDGISTGLRPARVGFPGLCFPGFGLAGGCCFFALCFAPSCVDSEGGLGCLAMGEPPSRALPTIVRPQYEAGANRLIG
jgi:hypothetical protein